MKKKVSFVLLVALLLNWGCQKQLAKTEISTENYNVSIMFRHSVGATEMRIGNTYKNGFNEPFTLSAFKYYISNIKLQQSNGDIELIDGLYHLVNEADGNSKSLNISVKHKQYSKLSFLIGVDSTRNVSGTQTGDLDPAKGMFWAWNSGYIMAKIEATSPLSTSTANLIEYHIGGFKTGQNTVRQVTFDLLESLAINIKENGTSQVVINADAGKWFKGMHDLKIADHSACTLPGVLATQYADNYAQMFNVVEVTNN